MDHHLAADLEHVLAHTAPLWPQLRGCRMFVTGGTGFVGCWLLESFAWANRKLDLKAEALVLTRDADAFARKAPHLACDPCIRFQRGDVRDFEFPAGEFPFVVHAATPGSAALNEEDPLLMLDIIVQGTRRVLDFAAGHGTRKLLLTSSGAVYGRQPPEVSHVSEDDRGGPDSTSTASAYGEGKRMAELLCAIYARQTGLEAKIARCFAFVGPYLPLDVHYAVGNFIRDALAGGPIAVSGDGTPLRSYLYAADLAIWLWTILLRGESCRPYNVGSPESIAIEALARLVARVVQPAAAVQVAQAAAAGRPAPRYIPSTQRATAELGLSVHVGLEDAIRRTAAWHAKRAIGRKESA